MIYDIEQLDALIKRRKEAHIKKINDFVIDSVSTFCTMAKNLNQNAGFSGGYGEATFGIGNS